MDLMIGLSAIKQTLDITKELRNIDDKIVVADFKLRISDIVDKLLDAKQALQDAQEERRILLLRVEQLEAAIKFKAKLQDERGKLYVLDDLGQRKSEPYCNMCFVKEEKMYRMLRNSGGGYGGPSYWCGNCRVDYYD